MSLRFCDDAPHGFHNFTGRARVCRWCNNSRQQLQQQAKETAAAAIASIRRKLALADLIEAREGSA